MPEGKFSNPEAIQQTETDTDKTEESPTEEKTSEVLDVVENQKSEEVWELKQKLERGIQEGKLLKSAIERKKNEQQKEVVLTPEQEKIKEDFLYSIKNGFLAVVKRSYNKLPFPKEFIQSKEVQQTALEGFAKCLNLDIMFGWAKEYLREFYINEQSEEVQKILQKEIQFKFEKGEINFIKKFRQEFPVFFESFIKTEEGLQSVYKGFESILKENVYVAKEYLKMFSISEQDKKIQEIINKGFLYYTEKKYNTKSFREYFFIPDEVVQQAMFEVFIINLKDGNISDALEIKEKNNIIVSSKELINESPEVQNLLSQLKQISPGFYDQALKSVDIVISLFPLAKDSEQVLKTIDKNPFLVDAVRENPRFGSKLLVKYPEFDETSQENITFLFNAKKEILEENPEIDPESVDFRIAMQEKLKTYKNNPEILRQIEAKGIDTDQWLNYSETEYFSLDSGESKLAFSETVATPINRIKETIASYSYRVKEVIKEYQKELQEHKIQAGNTNETSEMIKKMESELAKAKEEGNEAKVRGIEKGIASFQEKMKKGKEIPLWDKVIGDINSFDRLKNDVFKSHENVIKAEKEFEECVKDKSRMAMDIMEAKRLLAKAKEELKEKFGLLEQRIEDFRNNFVSVLAPALGKDRAESLLQEIQQGLGEQFNHYDADRSTLANLFSERSDKEKDKLDRRPMSIFVGARNPDIDLYQGNYSPCCICIESEHMGAESTIADYNTDLGIQIVNIWDETKNEPITAAWCWIGEDEDGNAALVVDNIESNTLYSANYSELLTEKLFEYLKNYAKSIGVKKVVQGKANNDLPVASQLAKMDSDNKEYQKVGGYNRENGYFLEAEETGTKIIWEEKEKKKLEKKERSEKVKIEFKNRELRPLAKEDLSDILRLEETVYENDDLNQGEDLKEDIENGKGFDYSVVLTGEKEAGKKEIIGYAIGVEDETDEGKPCVYLEDLVITPEAQGQGLGWEIMRKMIEKLKEKATKENKPILFDMHLRESSQNLMEKHKEDLERLGLTLVDEALVPDYYDEGDDALYRVYEVKG